MKSVTKIEEENISQMHSEIERFKSGISEREDKTKEYFNTFSEEEPGEFKLTTLNFNEYVRNIFLFTYELP